MALQWQQLCCHSLSQIPLLTVINKNTTKLSSPPPHTLSSSSFHSNSSLLVHKHKKVLCNTQEYSFSIDTLMVKPLRTNKRELIHILVFSTIVVNGALPNLCKTILAQEVVELERYTDQKEGFTLLKPTSYAKVEKAGATVLFEEINKGANNVGVVVNPVRLKSLVEFGTPQFVASKLIEAEKSKESTKEAEVIGIGERLGNAGLKVYEIEYTVDSTRGGMKRIFTAAFVASNKLYLLNISHSDKPENPLDVSTRTVLERVLHSFDVVPPVV